MASEIMGLGGDSTLVTVLNQSNPELHSKDLCLPRQLSVALPHPLLASFEADGDCHIKSTWLKC